MGGVVCVVCVDCLDRLFLGLRFVLSSDGGSQVGGDSGAGVGCGCGGGGVGGVGGEGGGSGSSDAKIFGTPVRF